MLSYRDFITLNMVDLGLGEILKIAIENLLSKLFLKNLLLLFYLICFINCYLLSLNTYSFTMAFICLSFLILTPTIGDINHILIIRELRL